MSSLYPPILESQRASIPSYLPGDTRTNFIIPITLPLSVSPADIRKGHIQVLIRRQIDMVPWCVKTSPSAPERDVIYLPGNALATDNQSISVPVNTTQPFIASDVITDEPDEMTGRLYTIQVRFGDEPLWAAANDFATWKATQIANSAFGEWSNTQRMYVYGVPKTGDIINIDTPDDVIAKIEWQYTPISQDPLTQVRVSYSWSTPDAYGNTFRSKNVGFSNSDGKGGGSFGTIDLGIMRFAEVTVGIRFTTVNNTVFDKTFRIGRHAFPVDNNAGNRIQEYPIIGDELEDGVLAMTFTGAYRRRAAVSSTEALYYNIYRVDVITLETVLLAKLTGAVGSNFTETIRDYSVEMGAEYIYMGVSYGVETGAVHYLLISPTHLDPITWNPPLYPGYGRQMNFDGNMFITTKWQQLRLQGNVTISSYQRNTNDSITPTIGGEYPFYSRSSKNNYRTFSLQGVVSMNFDTTHTFLKFKAQQSQEVVAAKNRIAYEYQLAVSALNKQSGDYNKKIKELQDQYYMKLKMVYEGINPPPVPVGEPDRLPIDWTTGQLWFVQNQDVDTIQLRNTDFFSSSQHSLSRKRVQDKFDRNNEWIDTLDNLDGNPDYKPRRVRGATTQFDYHLAQDVTQVEKSDRTSNLIYAERKFRDAVMQWLSNGEPKLIRSETEGNMIVMLTSISFAPLNKQRQVYTMSATVTEVAEYNLSNLILYGLVPVDFEPFYIPGVEFDFTPGAIDNNIDNAH